MGDYDYRIKHAGIEIETNDREFVERLIRENQPNSGKTFDGDGEGVDEGRLEELCQAWERKSSNSNYSPDSRASYCNAAEKLRFVLNDTPWMESP